MLFNHHRRVATSGMYNCLLALFAYRICCFRFHISAWKPAHPTFLFLTFTVQWISTYQPKEIEAIAGTGRRQTLIA
jgi:CHASE2 domain-containing sensor protein